MKKLIISSYAGILLLASGLSVVSAAPITGSNDNYDYLLGGEDLGKFSAGFYARDRSYTVNADPNGTQYKMQMQKMTAYVGYDVRRWMTVYGKAGGTDTKFDTGGYYPYGFFQGYNGTKPEYGFGVLLNLIDFDMADPTLMEDRLRITASAEYTMGGTEWAYASRNINWNEIYAALTFSLVNQIEGNKLYWPMAISLYAGPVFAQVISSSFDSNGSAGFNLGFEVMLTDKLTIDLGIEQIEAADMVLGFNLKF